MKEKLIDLLGDIQRCGEDFTEYEIYGMRLPNTVSNDDVADHLIANGVTFATDNNVGGWIPVTDERKPKQVQECLCICAFEDDLNCRWQSVLRWHGIPYQNNGYVNRPHFTNEGVDGMVVTHWMPLPTMPEPPKGE